MSCASLLPPTFTLRFRVTLPSPFLSHEYVESHCSRYTFVMHSVSSYSEFFWGIAQHGPKGARRKAIKSVKPLVTHPSSLGGDRSEIAA